MFPLKDFQAGVTAPPFHIRCRSTTAPCFEDGVFGKIESGEKLPDDITYSEWEKKFVKDNWGLTSGGNGGIMKMGKAINMQTAPDFSKYPVVEDHKAVEEFRKQIIADFGLKDSDVNLGGIKNTEVLQPFFARMQKIVRDTGMKMPSVYAAEIIEGDVCCIASFKPGENRLYISSQFFNSKAAIEATLKDWASKGIMPAQCKSIAYIAEHEAAHIRIPGSLIEADDALKIWKKRQLTNDNDLNKYEYFADVVAIYRMNPSKFDSINNIDSNARNILKAIDYLKNGGVSI